MEFTLKDVCNLSDALSYAPESGKKASFNPHGVRPIILSDHGQVVTVVFASNLQDALDEAVDQHKLDSYMIEEPGNTNTEVKGLPAADYPTLGTENEEGIARLGNASEPFDIENIDVEEMTCAAFFEQLMGFNFESNLK
jgi:hypothetical protein